MGTSSDTTLFNAMNVSREFQKVHLCPLTDANWVKAEAYIVAEKSFISSSAHYRINFLLQENICFSVKQYV